MLFSKTSENFFYTKWRAKDSVLQNKYKLKSTSDKAKYVIIIVFHKKLTILFIIIHYYTDLVNTV